MKVILTEQQVTKLLCEEALMESPERVWQLKIRGLVIMIK